MSEGRPVIAVFNENNRASAAVEALVREGFSADQLSLLISEDGREQHFEFRSDRSKAMEGMGCGAILGALVSTLSALAFPGSIFVSGPLAGAFAAGASGAAAGSLIGGLLGMGFSEEEVVYLEDGLFRGDIVLGVLSRSDEEEKKAREMLTEAGALRTS